jgi:hypothetical protein
MTQTGIEIRNNDAGVISTLSTDGVTAGQGVYAAKAGIKLSEHTKDTDETS